MKVNFPYEDHDDLQLLLRYNKLCEDYHKYFELPYWANPMAIDKKQMERSKTLAIKIDKVVVEGYRRGLMGKSKAAYQFQRDEVARKALAYLDHDALFQGIDGEDCFSPSLTSEGKLCLHIGIFKGRTDSLDGKYHAFVHYLPNRNARFVADYIEKLRIKSIEEDNKAIAEIRGKLDGQCYKV